jgi:YD repeat-containing protein
VLRLGYKGLCAVSTVTNRNKNITGINSKNLHRLIAWISDMEQSRRARFFRRRRPTVLEPVLQRGVGCSNDGVCQTGPLATTVRLTYDPAGRLHQVASSSTTRFLYVGADVIAEYNASGTVLRRWQLQYFLLRAGSQSLSSDHPA